MIKLNATITVIDGSGQTLDSLSSNLSGNNISSNIGDVKGVKRSVGNPFIIGQSKIGDGSTLSSGENYFIGSQLTNADKSFTNAYTITISGSNITSFNILFDAINNVYPTTITIDGTDYANDKANFMVANLTSESTHTIAIANLNKESSVLVITGLYIGLTIEINDRNLISLSRKISDRADNKLPSWGIMSNTGDIEFSDFSGEVRDYAEMQLLKQGLNVTINIKDTLSNRSQQIGEFITDTWSYDNDSRKVSLSLQDELVEWQDILIDNYPMQNGMYFNSIYNYLRELTPEKYNMKSISNLDKETRYRLNNMLCKYPYLEKGSLWNEWQKLCEVCALYIYKKNDGSTICTCDFRS